MKVKIEIEDLTPEEAAQIICGIAPTYSPSFKVVEGGKGNGKSETLTEVKEKDTKKRTRKAKAPDLEPEAEDTEDEEEEEGNGEDVDLAAALKGKRKLREILNTLVDNGYSTADELVEICEELQDDVPALSKISNLEERVRRAAEVVLQVG